MLVCSVPYKQDIAARDAELVAMGLPLRYLHSQGAGMPENEYSYNQWLVEMAGPGARLKVGWWVGMSEVWCDVRFELVVQYDILDGTLLYVTCLLVLARPRISPDNTGQINDPLPAFISISD